MAKHSFSANTINTWPSKKTPVLLIILLWQKAADHLKQLRYKYEYKHNRRDKQTCSDDWELQLLMIWVEWWYAHPCFSQTVQKVTFKIYSQQLQLVIPLNSMWYNFFNILDLESIDKSCFLNVSNISSITPISNNYAS